MNISSITLNSQNTIFGADTLIATQLLNQVKGKLDSGLYKEALDIAEEARDIYSTHKLWREVVQCEVQLAQLADNFDTPDIKITHVKNALSIAVNNLEKDDILMGSVLRQKAETFMWLEQLDSANIYLKRALPIFKKNAEWVEVGWTEVMLAVNNLNTYELDSCALHLNKLATVLKQKELVETDRAELEATLLDLRGIMYDYQGDYNLAIKNLNEAIEVSQGRNTITSSDSGFISNQYNTLGTIYLGKGDYLRAEDNFLQALQFDQEGMNDPNLIFNIGTQYLKQKKYQKAIEYFEKSANVSRIQRLNLVEKEFYSKRFVESLNSLCFCYRVLGKYDQALAYCQDAEKQFADYNNHISWANLGNIYIDIKQPKKALHYLEMAAEDLVDKGKGSRYEILTLSKILYRIGKAHLLNKDTYKALQAFQKSLVVNHKFFDDSLNHESNPPLLGIYDPIYFLEAISAKANTQALLATDNSSLKTAFSTYQLSIQWMDSLQASYALESTQIDWNSEFKSIYEEAINTSFKLYKSTKETRYLDFAFTFSEKSRSSILLEQLKSKEGKFSAGIPDSLLQEGKDLNLDIAFYENKLQEAIEVKDSAKLKLYQNYISQSRLNLAALEEKLEKDYPKFYQSKYAPEQVSIHQIQENMLDENSALMEYFFGDSVAYVFVIDKESATMIRLEELSSIKLKIAEFMNQLKDIDAFKRNAKNAIATYNEISFALYDQLLENPISQISTTIDHLIIIPDDKLNALSFEALTDDINVDYDFDFARLPFLIYKYKFQYSYSVQLLFENQKRSAGLIPNTRCLGFAPSYEPDQSMESSGDFEQLRNTKGNLKGTAIEISNISNFVDGQFYFGKMATESQFKEDVHGFGLLHLAMHGTVDLENSNYNHLKFSDIAQKDLEDNLLHQYEIGNMDLDAQMVVLSACETGLGRYEKGEGVFSLARSFMYAGVPCVVMSLWRVSDASTSQLMPHFYQNLTSNQSKVTALHEAKLNYLTSSDVSMRHPFYWSAFVVIGDGEVLKSANNYFFFWIVGSIMLLILIGWTTRKMTKC